MEEVARPLTTRRRLFPMECSDDGESAARQPYEYFEKGWTPEDEHFFRALSGTFEPDSQPDIFGPGSYDSFEDKAGEEPMAKKPSGNTLSDGSTASPSMGTAATLKSDPRLEAGLYQNVEVHCLCKW